MLAFGSSNTARRIEGMHWFDCLDLAIHGTYGRLHTCINTGVGGDTTRDLLGRFDRDAAYYRPDLVIITIGGNDSKPAKDLSATEFENNLLEIEQRFDTLGTVVIFQTYYSAREDMIEADHFARFHEFMQIVRDTAKKTGSVVIDHLARWEPLRRSDPTLYHSLMADGMHVNRLGNLILGLDLARYLGVPLANTMAGTIDSDGDGFWDEARRVQKLMDSYEG